MRKHLLVWRLRHHAKQMLTLCQDCSKNIVVDTLIKIKAKAVMCSFPHVQAKIVTDTLTRY